ncbi:MAG: universal stress protein [Anaerolineaceae bacterium]|nr:universal stress protein [Anaerolineaceae bacterium]
MRILITTSGSAESDLAVRLGGVVHQMVGGTLTLLTVIKHEAERTQAESILVRAKMLLGKNIPVETQIRTGHTAEEIVHEAVMNRHELVVMGEQKQQGLAGRWLPPTAERVVARMPCPVLIARGEIRPLREVLVCESGRDPSLLNRLITHLAPLLKKVDELTALHVMSQMAAAPGVPGWELRADADELIERHTVEGNLLEADLARLSQLNVRLEAKVRHGLVVREILAEMQSGDYDLVAIGAHQGKGWERFLLDDLAHELICHADRPLLVV